MFEKFTYELRRSIIVARLAALARRSTFLREQDLLLGFLLVDPYSEERLGVPPKVTNELIQFLVRGEGETEAAKIPDLGLDEGAKHALAYAAQEAERRSDNHIGLEHMLHAIVRAEKNREILRARGIDPVRATLKLVKEDTRATAAKPPQPPPTPPKPQTAASQGIATMVRVCSNRRHRLLSLEEDPTFNQAIDELKREGPKGAKALADLINELLAARCAEIQDVLLAASRLPSQPELVNAVRKVISAPPVITGQQGRFPPVIVGGGKIGWDDAASARIKEQASEILASLRPAPETAPKPPSQQEILRGHVPQEDLANRMAKFKEGNRIKFRALPTVVVASDSKGNHYTLSPEIIMQYMRDWENKAWVKEVLPSSGGEPKYRVEFMGGAPNHPSAVILQADFVEDCLAPY